MLCLNLIFLFPTLWLCFVFPLAVLSCGKVYRSIHPNIILCFNFLCLWVFTHSLCIHSKTFFKCLLFSKTQKSFVKTSMYFFNHSLVCFFTWIESVCQKSYLWVFLQLFTDQLSTNTVSAASNSFVMGVIFTGGEKYQFNLGFSFISVASFRQLSLAC